MLVPRSYKYANPSSQQPSSSTNESSRRRSSRHQSVPPIARRLPSRKLDPPKQHTFTEPSDPVTIPTPKPSNAPAAEPNVSENSLHHEMPTLSTSATVNIGQRKSSSHGSNALPPAVAALLAVTSIPPRRPNRYRAKPGSDRRISIEELVKDWKSDDSLKSSYGTSPALDALLEDTEDCIFDDGVTKDTVAEPSYLTTRSASSESMPSLEADDRSVLSIGSPSTPESLRSQRSYQNLKNPKARSVPPAEECITNHPLVHRTEAEDDELMLPVQKKTLITKKSRSSFKSNLTTSLQSLKNAAVQSISAFGRASSSPSLSRQTAAPIDDMLWSHPYLFPKFSSEIRPATEGMVSQAERRYLNPMPLTFEEQEAPFQQALHAPFLAEAVHDAPTIQLQTYNRGRKRAGPKRAVPNPNSEAGRALLGSAGVRHREVRENSDFLRVVVLEMNMRREGKLESGRAKIWLPPRVASAVPEQDRVPQRWVGVSAY